MGSIMMSYRQKLISLDITGKLLSEETKRLDGFMEKLETYFKISPELRQKIVEFIENSNCERIDFADFKFSVLGVALSTGVLINNKLLFNSLPRLLFVIFHEIAHQYQFKKYGADVMYSLYTEDMPLRRAAEIMKKTEMVADEYAFRKMKQLRKLGLVRDIGGPGPYKNVPIEAIMNTLSQIMSGMQYSKVGKTPREISEYIYNMVKRNPNENSFD